MSESTDVLDKMVLGETSDEMLDDGAEALTSTQVEQSEPLKTEEAREDNRKEANNTDSTENVITTNGQVVPDKVSSISYCHVTRCCRFRDLDDYPALKRHHLDLS